MEKMLRSSCLQGAKVFTVSFVEGLPTFEFMPQGGKLRVLTDGR
jgi:hypothetical protein